jgi:regulatory protein
LRRFGAQASAEIEALLERWLANGALDDARWAELRARHLHERGKPVAAIRADLRAHVAADLVEPALATLREPGPDPDREAALRLARRRRLGPFRPPEQRLAHRMRDLAALQRAGFGLQVARRLIEAEDGAAAAAWAAGEE